MSQDKVITEARVEARLKAWGKWAREASKVNLGYPRQNVILAIGLRYKTVGKKPESQCEQAETEVLVQRMYKTGEEMPAQALTLEYDAYPGAQEGLTQDQKSKILGVGKTAYKDHLKNGRKIIKTYMDAKVLTKAG